MEKVKTVKKTKKDFYNELLELNLNNDQREFVENEIFLLESKASRAKGKTNTELENDLKKIIDFMEFNKEYQVKDIMALLEVSNQKASSRLKVLVDSEKVERVAKGKATVFVLVTKEEK